MRKITAITVLLVVAALPACVSTRTIRLPVAGEVEGGGVWVVSQTNGGTERLYRCEPADDPAARSVCREADFR